MKPTRFDIRANDVSNAGIPVIEPWRRIVIDPEYAGSWIVAGGVDGDGQVELVSPHPIDIDRDGKDEIVAGYAMIIEVGKDMGLVRGDLK